MESLYKESIRHISKNYKEVIPVYKPYFSKETLKYAHDAIDSTWVSSRGKYLELSTDLLKEILKVDNLKLVNNGTSATHLVVKSMLRHRPSIQEVVVPNNCYVAAWNSIIYERLKIIPVEADIETWNFNLDKLSSVLQTKDPQKTAIMIVPNLGNIINTKKLKRENPDFIFIEDNCEGFYGKYEGDFSGTGCLASSLSFFGNKTITSGEGGAFITNDDSLFEFINKIQGQGQTNVRYVHDELGYNYRMTNIQAAILYGQLKVIDEIIEKKEELFNFYKKELSDLVESGLLSFQKEDPGTKHSNWMFGVKASTPCLEIQNFLAKKGIDTRPMFYDILKHKHLAQETKGTSVSVAKSLQKKCFIIPSFPSITKNERQRVVNGIKEYFLVNKNLTIGEKECQK